MIKINDIIINKVQKSKDEVITELPIVKIGTSLLHLGYNTYKTAFDNPNLITPDNPFWSLRNFKIGTKLTEADAVMPSTYIKAWLYSDNITVKEGTKVLTLRLSFNRSPWQYKTGRNYVTDLKVELTYTRRISGGQIYVDRKWRMYTIHGSTITDISSYEEDNKYIGAAYGGLVSIIIPGNTFIPKCYNAFLTTSSSISYADDTPFTGNLPITPNNVDIGVSVQIKEEGDNPEYIKSYIEIGSYKPANFSEYSPNYCLYIPNVKRIEGISEVGQIISTPYFTASSSSSDDSGSSSGSDSGSSGSSSGGGGVSATSKILIDLEGTTKNAEELHKDDKIVAYNKADGTFIESTIEAVYIQRKPIALYTLAFEDDTELSITAYHKILTDNGLISVLDDNDAEQLVAGSKVISKDGEKTIKSAASRTTEDGEIVYNFRTVEGDMFIAGDIIIKNESKNTIAVMKLIDDSQVKM